jgi:hypothetical protein
MEKQRRNRKLKATENQKRRKTKSDGCRHSRLTASGRPPRRVNAPREKAALHSERRIDAGRFGWKGSLQEIRLMIEMFRPGGFVWIVKVAIPGFEKTARRDVV